jgi:hypothetical protein
MSSPKEVPAVPLVVSVADHDNYCFTIVLDDLFVHTTLLPLILSLATNMQRNLSLQPPTQAHNPPSPQATRAYGAHPCETLLAKLPRTLPVLRSKNFLTVAARTSGRGHMNRNCLSGRISWVCAYSRLQMPMGRLARLLMPYQTSSTRMSSRHKRLSI